MDRIAKLVGQLKSPDKNKRYDACEYLRVSAAVTPEAIRALEEATHDSERQVAEAAERALAIHVAQGPTGNRQRPPPSWSMPPLDLSEERLSAIVSTFQTRLRWYFAGIFVAIPCAVALMVSIRDCIGEFSAAEAPAVVLCAPFLPCADASLGLPAVAWLVLLAAAAAICRLSFRCPNCGATPRRAFLPYSCAKCGVPLRPRSLNDYIGFMRGRGAP